jgi:hypothetical protein
MKRINTQLESAGAEHLVLGNLLIRKIQSFITSQNFEDYDIVAVNPEKNTSAKIQVKSRLKEHDNSFPIKKFKSDFVVFVRLNCARTKRNIVEYPYRESPEYYIFPTELCKDVNKGGNWNKVHLKDIHDVEKYKDNWQIIIDKLNE